MRIAFICIIATLFYQASCEKRIECKEIVYNFESFYRVYPNKDSIQLGDTLWVESNMDVNLKDLSSNQVIDFSGALNLGPSISYIQLKGGDRLNTGSSEAAISFQNILIHGIFLESLNTTLVRYFRYKEELGMYKFKVGIIPQKKGLFAIYIDDMVGVYRKSNQCVKASIVMSFQNTNQHIYLYEQSRPGYTVSSYERTHGYFFKVY